ncbi:hypothetical protein WAI453_001360 [Rhynchosporium graminicola]
MWLMLEKNYQVENLTNVDLRSEHDQTLLQHKKLHRRLSIAFWHCHVSGKTLRYPPSNEDRPGYWSLYVCVLEIGIFYKATTKSTYATKRAENEECIYHH